MFAFLSPFCVAFGFVCFALRCNGQDIAPWMRLQKVQKKKQRTRRVRAKNRRKKRQRRGPEGSEEIRLPVGEGKKQQEQSDQKKAAETIVFRENAERIRCPKGSTK